jgi:nucleoside-diphosphate-sugar epimerase
LGYEVYEVSREAGDQGKKRKIYWDLESDVSPDLPALAFYVHCAPIWVLPDNIALLASAGVKRVIAFSSSSAISKAKSADAGERALAGLLRNGEKGVVDACERDGLSLTLFRPTMIYGFGRDQNISHIAGIIQRYRCGVVAGGGSGLRQPVHVLDLVDAVEKVLDNPQTYSKTYILNGGETFTYREMMRRVFVGMGRKPRIVSIPVRVSRLLMKLAAMTGKFRYTAEMADRMNVDLSFNDKAAARDFGYAPSAFLENPERDLPGTRHARPGR